MGEYDNQKLAWEILQIHSSDKCIEIEWNFRDELIEYAEKKQKEKMIEKLPSMC